MANLRRLTVNPPLTEAEFAGFCGANLDLKTDCEPSGVIILRRKRKRSDEHGDWVLSGIDLRDNERPSAGTGVGYIAEDTENLQAIEVLDGRLFRALETRRRRRPALYESLISRIIRPESDRCS